MSNKQISFDISKARSCLEGLVLKERINTSTLTRIIMSNIVYKLGLHYTSGDIYKDLKTQLIAYLEKADKNGIVRVQYNMCEYGYGRVYPEQSLSLCCIRREVRHALAVGTYVDIDIKCAHHAELLQICDFYGIPCEELRDYVENRDEHLKAICEMYGCKRDDAKTLFIILLYNGSFQSWADKLGIFKKPCRDILRFINEFKAIGEAILKRNEKWYNSHCENYLKAKKKTDKYGREYDYSNPIGTCLSIYLQEWERRALEVAYRYLQNNGVIRDNVAVLCYDGLMVEKDNFKPEMLREIEREVKEQLHLNLVFEVKGFDEGKEVLDDIVVPMPDPNSLVRFTPEYFKELNIYQDQKEYFERFFCKINDQGGFMQVCKYVPSENNPKCRDTSNVFFNFEKFQKTFNQYKTTDFKITHERGDKIGYKEVRKSFVELWTDDEDIRVYQTMNFYPLPKTESEMDEVRWNKSNTEDVFNLFLGYNNIINSPLPMVEEAVDEEKVLKVIQSWRDIVLNLCEGDEAYYNFYVNFLSLKLLEPTNRLGIAIILEGLQGSFKNAHLEPIKSIIGRRHAFETANIEDILGTHAEGTVNKLLLILNELEGKDSMDFEGKLKSLITEDSIVSNMKFQKPISIDNYSTLIITTNKKNAIKIDVLTGNRRWVAFRSTEKYAYKSQLYNKEQITSIINHWKKPSFIACLNYYLTKMINGKEFNFSHLPRTKAIETLELHSRPTLYWFLMRYLGQYEVNKQHLPIEPTPEELEAVEVHNCFATEVYREYKNWCVERGVETVLSQIKFQNEITNFNLGIEFVRDNKTNSNRCVFKYKDAIEVFENKFNIQAPREGEAVVELELEDY